MDFAYLGKLAALKKLGMGGLGLGSGSSPMPGLNQPKTPAMTPVAPPNPMGTAPGPGAGMGPSPIASPR